MRGWPKGKPGLYTGRKVSEKTKRKQLLAQKKTYGNGRIPWNKGKHLSVEHRRKIGETHRGRTSPTKGRKNISRT